MTLSMELLVCGSLLQSPGQSWEFLISSSELVSDLSSGPVSSPLCFHLPIWRMETSGFPDAMTILIK